MVIKRSDRLGEVLSRDARLIDAFVATSTVFKGLRDAKIRKTMGRLATVEQAATAAGLDADYLVERLNRYLRADGDCAEPDAATRDQTSHTKERRMDSLDMEVPPALARIPEDQMVELDVREALRNGEEPFSRIMAAMREVPPGGGLSLRAIFEPVPLYAVLGKQGFDHYTEQLGEDDWRVRFYPAASESPPTPANSPVPPSATDADAAADEDVVVLDVRGMEPPEPMVLTLAALENLDPGKTLLHINERVPRFLLPKLESLGFSYEVREQNDRLVRVFIRHIG